MAQNVIQNSSFLLPEDIILYVAALSTEASLLEISSATWHNLGALTEYSRESAIATVQPAAFNVEHQQILTKEAETINFTMQEFNSSLVNICRGGVSAQVSTFLPGSTSSEACIVLYSGGNDTLTPFMLYEKAKYADGRSIQTYFPYCHFVSGGTRNPKAQNTGEYSDTPFTVEARESPTVVYNNKKQYRIEIYSTDST